MPEVEPAWLAQASAATLQVGQKTILDHIDLTVAAGERIAIVGRSGAGKTTLLNCFGGDPFVSGGSIFLFGRDLKSIGSRELRSVRLQTARIAQGYELVGDLSALENVLLGAFAQYRMPRLFAWSHKRSEVTRAKSLLVRFGLSGAIHQRSNTLSGGERQRVALARAMMSNPAIIFADEPISSLDLSSGKQVLDYLHQLGDAGVAVICALHQIDLAVQWATKIVVMANGKVVGEGPSSEFDLETLESLLGTD